MSAENAQLEFTDADLKGLNKTTEELSSVLFTKENMDEIQSALEAEVLKVLSDFRLVEKAVISLEFLKLNGGVVGLEFIGADDLVVDDRLGGYTKGYGLDDYNLSDTQLLMIVAAVFDAGAILQTKYIGETGRGEWAPFVGLKYIASSVFSQENVKSAVNQRLQDLPNTSRAQNTGVVAGFVAGALAGLAIGGPVGAIIGAVAGFFVGGFGGKAIDSKTEEERKDVLTSDAKLTFVAESEQSNKEVDDVLAILGELGKVVGNAPQNESAIEPGKGDESKKEDVVIPEESKKEVEEAKVEQEKDPDANKHSTPNPTSITPVPGA